MKDESEKDHGPEAHATRWLDDPANVKKLIRGFLGLCAIAVLAGVYLQFFGNYGEHGHERIFTAEGWFLFYPLYGFLAYVALVFISKGLRKILMRDEDYYDR